MSIRKNFTNFAIENLDRISGASEIHLYTMDMKWTLKSFDELSKKDLYDILRLRAEVFVVEQNCVYNDLDGADDKSYHLCAYDEDGCLAIYLRVLPVGHEQPGMSSLGRFIIAPKHRGKGLAHDAMERGIEACKTAFPDSIGIAIEAQAHLEKVYNQHGFKSVGEVFMLDGIPHIRMEHR